VKRWGKPAALPPTLAQMAERGPLVLCLSCGTYRSTVPALMGVRSVEVLEAHDDARGQCEGSGDPWEDVRAVVSNVVPVVRR
jgi:hypothetical protein